MGGQDSPDLLVIVVSLVREASLETLESTEILGLSECLAARASRVCKAKWGDMEILEFLAYLA